MTELVRPRVDLHAAWTTAHREWGPGLHEDGFGLTANDDVDTATGFRAWVERLRAGPVVTWWIMEHEAVVGGIALRPDADERVARHGHLGYGIRPSARGRGIAVWAVRQVLARAVELGVDPVTAVVRADNAASIAVLDRLAVLPPRVEEHGGVELRRFTLPASAAATLLPVSPADVADLRVFLQDSDLTTAGLDAATVRVWIERGADGRITGSTGFEPSSDGAHVLLRSVAVADHARGAGVGRRLADAALDQAARSGATRAWLFSRRSGPFWQRLGFVPADRDELAAHLSETQQVRLFRQTGQLDHEVAWTRAIRSARSAHGT